MTKATGSSELVERLREGASMTDETEPLPDLGSAADAIDYALGHLDYDLECYDFLEDWRDGDISDWPGYPRWLKIQQTHAPSTRLKGRATPISGNALPDASVGFRDATAALIEPPLRKAGG